jgi:uncharacterized protein (TIGR02996 family)
VAADYANDAAALDSAIARCAESRALRNELGACAFGFLQNKRHRDALRIYDAILEFSDLELEHYANALWVVQRDNTGLPVDAARARHYLERCLPHGPRNPTLYINAAGVYTELGELDTAIVQLVAAAEHGVDIRPFLDEPLFAPLREREQWRAVRAAAGEKNVEPLPTVTPVDEVPAWAGFFSREDYALFRAQVERVLEERGVEFVRERLDEGDVAVPLGGRRLKRFSLRHAARNCVGAKREHWKSLLAEILRHVAGENSILAPALKAISGGDLTGAVPVLVRAWRDTRSPRIADLLDKLSECLGARPGYGGEWIEKALRERPAEAPDLVSHCTSIQIEHTHLWIREGLWDPRATTAMLAILSTPPTLEPRKRIEEAYLIAIDTVVALDDKRAIEPFEALSRHYQTQSNRIAVTLARELASAAKTIAAHDRPKQLSIADDQACHEMAALLAEKTHIAGAHSRAASEAEMLDEIVRKLDDDGPRLVYADWLEGRDDTRGEFITLQIRKPGGPREAELLEEGRLRWLGELADVVFVGGTRWERGFPFAFSITKPEMRDLERLIEHRGWSTAVEISFYEWLQYQDAVFTRLLTGSRFGSLRKLNGISCEALIALTRDETRAFETVEIETSALPDAAAFLAALERLPALKMLRMGFFNPPELAAINEPELAVRLERLALRLLDHNLREWLAVANDSPFGCVEFSFRNNWHADQFHGFNLRFTRVGGRLSALEVSRSVVSDHWREKNEYDLPKLLRYLEKLPANAVTRFTLVRDPTSAVQPSVKELDDLRMALARFRRLAQVNL